MPPWSTLVLTLRLQAVNYAITPRNSASPLGRCTKFTVEAVRLAEVRDAPHREHHAAVKAREAGGGWLVDRAHDDDGAGLGDTSLSRLMVMTTEAESMPLVGSSRKSTSRVRGDGWGWLEAVGVWG